MKRALLAVAFLALWPLQVLAWTHGGGGTPPVTAAFQGNPNPSIASITAQIDCSRSGTLQTPAFVQCSIPNTGYSGTNTSAGGAYEDLEVKWNFGDAAGTETFLNPLSGQTVNANDHQWGPEATYVWRQPGTYTVTANFRACTNGPAPSGGGCLNNAYTNATATKSFTVSAFSASGGTFYYDTAGSGTTCSIGSPCAISQFASKLANNTQHYFNCGETFTGTTNISISNKSGVRVAAGGSACPGAAPIININSGTNAPFLVNASSGTTSDIVDSGLVYQTSGTGVPSIALVLINTSGTAVAQDIYHDQIACNDTVGSGGIQCIQTEPNTTTTVSNVAIWGGTVTQPLTGTTCIGILDGPQQWYSIVGVTISGNGNKDATKCHHIYIHTQQHVLARWNVGGASCSGASCTPTRNYTIKDSVDCSNVSGGISGASDDCVPTYTCPGPCYAQWHLMSENKLFGTAAGRFIGNGNLDPTATRMKQYVDQQNQFNNLFGYGVGNQTGIFQPITSETLTVRDEQVCNPGDQWFTPNGDGQAVYLQGSYYRNNVYQSTIPASSGQGTFMFGSPTAITWGGGSPLKQVVTDNVLQNTNSGATANIEISYIKSSDWVTAGSVVDRNSYYVPNSASNFLLNNGTGVTFSAWQGLGWDTHGASGVNPNWPGPSQCNFGPWPFGDAKYRITNTPNFRITNTGANRTVSP